MRKLLIVLLMVMILPTVLAVNSAEENQIFKQRQGGDFKIVCLDETTGSMCASGTSCNVSIFYPNSSVLVNNAAMTRNTNYYNYTLSSAQTDTLGTYDTVVVCADSSKSAPLTPSYIVTTTGDNQGLTSDLWRIAVIMTLIVTAGMLAFGSYSFDPSRWLLKTALFIASMFIVILAIGVSLTYSVDPNVNKLMTTALITISSITLIIIVSLFIYYTKAVFKAVQDSKAEKDAEFGV